MRFVRLLYLFLALSFPLRWFLIRQQFSFAVNGII